MAHHLAQRLGKTRMSLMKYKEVAKKLSISETQVYALKATGKLPFIKIGRSTRFDEQDIQNFIQERKRRIQ